MKKAINACAIIALLGTIVIAYETRLAAQDRNRIGLQGFPLATVGPGSSIGITVRDSDSGVVVQEVREESPASRAGVQEGDVVTEFDGERTRSATQLTRVVRETAPGRMVKMTVLRNGTPTTLDVAPEIRRADDLRLPNLARDFERRFQVLPRDFNFDFADPGFSWYSPRRLGVTITPLSDQLASYFGVTGGVLVSDVAAGSAGEMAGLKAGDVITMVRGQTVTSSADVLRELRELQTGSALEIRVMRDRKEVTLTAKMPEPPERIRAFTRRGGQAI
jgi:serine protease Do